MSEERAIVRSRKMRAARLSRLGHAVFPGGYRALRVPPQAPVSVGARPETGQSLDGSRTFDTWTRGSFDRSVSANEETAHRAPRSEPQTERTRVCAPRERVPSGAAALPSCLG